MAGLQHRSFRDRLPFRYSDDEWTDLGSLSTQQYPDPVGRLANWGAGVHPG